MKQRVFLAALVGGSAVAGQRLGRRYRLDLQAAYARLAAIDRTTIKTGFGTVEYAEIWQRGTAAGGPRLFRWLR